MIDLTFLRQFSETLRDAETIEELWSGVCRLLPSSLPIHEATLALADESGQFAEVRGSFFAGKPKKHRATLPWNELIAACSEFSPPGAALSPAAEISSFFFEEKFGVAVIIPLHVRAGSALQAAHDLILHGALAFSHEPGRAFSPAQREGLAALANLFSAVLRAGFFARLDPAWQQRQAEAGLQRREKELENLVFVISHNLKTPIVSIQGFANLLREELGPHLGEEHAHFLDRIQKNAGLMEKMILDLLEFYRLGREAAKFEWVDVQGLVSRVIDDLKLLEQTSVSPSEFGKPVAGEKNVKTEFVLPPRLPQIVAEAGGLKLIFENLLNNAMKYRRPEAAPRIEIGWQEQPRFHAFWVCDNGMGMEPPFLQKAFNLFQRGPHAGKIAGTGVGLALVRRVIENHQGLIKLDSKPGEGTTVYFTLPKLDKETGLAL